jgi:hypothetical protein
MRCTLPGRSGLLHVREKEPKSSIAPADERDAQDDCTWLDNVAAHHAVSQSANMT